MSERKKICDLGLTNTQKTNFQTAYEHSQVEHAPSNAQANIIENISVNGTSLTPDSNKSVDISIFPNIVDVNGRGYYCPRSLQLGINGIVVSTINANGNNYFMEKGAIVYRYTFS